MNYPDIPDMYDFSHGSLNPYVVETRHHLIPPCYWCKRFRPVKLDGAEYYAFFQRGAKIHEAFPTLTMEQREVMISGVHPECWKEMFKDEEDEG